MMHEYKLNFLIVDDRSCTQNLKVVAYLFLFISLLFYIVLFLPLLLPLPFVNSVQLYIYWLICNNSLFIAIICFIKLLAILNSDKFKLLLFYFGRYAWLADYSESSRDTLSTSRYPITTTGMS